jgi:chromosomal replication initiator protein
MGRKKLTPEEREQKKEEVINRLRKLHNMVDEINTITKEIGMRDRMSTSINASYFSLKPSSIVDYVNKRFNVNVALRTRKQEVVFARQVSMHLLKKFTRLSMKEISQYAGTTDHSTVIAGLKRLNNLLETEEATRMIVEECESDIYKHFKEQLKK